MKMKMRIQSLVIGLARLSMIAMTAARLARAQASERQYIKSGRRRSDMKGLSLTIRSFALLACLTLFSSISQAQIARAYVSNEGDDTNACTPTSPCRQIDRGVDVVQSGGEVVVLNSGDYDPTTISKAVTVVAVPGAMVGIATDAGAAVTVTTGASDTVLLRGLTLNGLGSQQTGIAFNSGQSLHVEGCTINGFGIGIGAPLSGGLLFVNDTQIRKCISAMQVADGNRASIDHCRIEDNGVGLIVFQNAKVTIRDSVAAGNTYAGLRTDSAEGATGELNVERCMISNNGTGIFAGGGSVVRVANSTITDNGIGLVTTFSARILSRTPATNTVAGNTSGEVFTAYYAAR
jgi:nitrous oxidase accessory protein NosD